MANCDKKCLILASLFFYFTSCTALCIYIYLFIIYFYIAEYLYNWCSSTTTTSQSTYAYYFLVVRRRIHPMSWSTRREHSGRICTFDFTLQITKVMLSLHTCGQHFWKELEGLACTKLLSPHSLKLLKVYLLTCSC